MLLAVAGFAAPALAVRQEATARRAATRHALAAFLDLVVIAVAGGAGTEAALTYAAATGQGPAFAQIRQALETARLTRQPPWATLGQLGSELGVAELTKAGGLHHPGRHRRRQGQGQPRRQVRGDTGPAARRGRGRRPGRHRAHVTCRSSSCSRGSWHLIGYPAIVHVINGI